ncbi:MAG: ATPase, T2SS/T4P/T4SS family, partial [Candidatus Pacearchaeota archaeon]|nr:ATPase, T2SS/T4P/T4SS family [Candidatus Pacearchaeota archaeon]
MVNILEHLVQRKTLSEEQAAGVRVASERTGRHADEVILEQGLIDEETLFAEKASALGLELRRVEVDQVPLEVLGVVPEDSASYYYMIPLAKQDHELEVGMVFPEDVEAQEALKFLARQENFTYRISLITLSSFRELLRKYYGLKQEVGKALKELGEEKETTKEGMGTRVSLPRIVEEAPITKMVAVILRTAVELKASDVHVEPFSGKVRVRFRILGQLQSSLQLPERVKRSIVARIKILAGMKIDETRIPQDGRFSMVVDGKSIDFRVATLPTPKGEKVAIRVLDPDAALHGFEQLGLEGENLQKVKAAIRRPYGLILVTGPTGSGKTTTLYTILQLLNTGEQNIVSLEDPVEYYIDGVNQSQIQPAVGYDFASGLRQILRQDPNIIMVGEVRDEESASLVTHAALTGHLVLSTLHTNSVVGIVPRLIEMGVKKYLIHSTL